MPDSPTYAIEAIDVVKSFGKVRALQGVSLSARTGRITAIVGDNGAGKSTLIKCIAGFHRHDGGTILVNDDELHASSPSVARSYGVETVYQDLALCDQLSIYQNIFVGRELTRWFGPIRLLDKRRMRHQAQEAIDRMLINAPDVRKPVKRLSGGQRQAIAIARAVLWGSGVIILDEPTAALGAQEKSVIEGKIQEIVAEGNSVILVSHDFDQVARLASDVWVMRGGRVAAHLAEDETTPQSILAAVTGTNTSSMTVAGTGVSEQ